MKETCPLVCLPPGLPLDVVVRKPLKSLNSDLEIRVVVNLYKLALWEM